MSFGFNATTDGVIVRNYQDIVWAGDRFVALPNASTGTIYSLYSFDGITWQQGGAMPASQQLGTSTTSKLWQAVAYGPSGRLVAVPGSAGFKTVNSVGGGTIPNTQFRVAYSDDKGMTWQQTFGITFPTSGNAGWTSPPSWNTVFWGSQGFTAIAGTYGGHGGMMMQSGDGVSWTFNDDMYGALSGGMPYYATVSSRKNWRRAVVGADASNQTRVVAVSSGSTGMAAWSSSGSYSPTSWNTSTLSGVDLIGLAYSATLKRFVAITQSGVTYYSTNGGANWSQGGFLTPSSANWYDIAWGPDENGVNRFVAIQVTGQKASTSIDGASWIAVDMPIGSNNVWTIGASGEGKFTAVGTGGTAVYSANVFDNVPPPVSVISGWNGSNTTTPGFPDTTTASSPTTNFLSWTNSGDASQFRLYRDGELIAEQAGKTFTDSGIDATTSHSYYVDSADSDGNWAGNSNTITLQYLPHPVLSVNRTPVKTPILSWDMIPGATYMILRSTGTSGTPGTSYGTNVSSPWTQTGVATGNYRYMVQATNPAGTTTKKLNSNIVQVAVNSALVDDVTPPAVPVLSGWYADPDQAALSWQGYSDTDAAGFEVFRDGVLLKTVGQVFTTTDALADGVTATYRIRSVDASGNRSALSNEVVIENPLAPPDTTAPDAPVLEGFVLSDTQGLLFWQPTETNLTYQVMKDGVQEATGYVSESGDYLFDGDMLGTPHMWKIRSRDAAGNWSAYSNEVPMPPTAPDETAPETPVLTGEAFALENVLNWSVPEPGLTIRLFRDGTRIKTFTASETTWTDVIDTSVSHSYYLVFLDSSANVSEPSNTVTLQYEEPPPPPDITPPTAPVLTGEISGASVNLNWNFNADAARYEVFEDGTLLGNLTDHFYSATAKVGSHFYYVRAFDALNNMSQSNTVTLILDPPDTTAPDPVVLSGTNINVGLNSLTWSAVDGATSYRVYRDGSLVSTQPDVNYLDGVDAAVSHSYYITSGDAAGNWSANSNTVTLQFVAPKDTTPPVPVVLTGNNVNQTSNQLNWSAVVDAVIYRIYRDGVIIATQTTPNYTDSAVKATVSHAYKVKSSDAAGNWSADSNIVTLIYTPPPPPPTDPNGDDPFHLPPPLVSLVLQFDILGPTK